MVLFGLQLHGTGELNFADTIAKIESLGPAAMPRWSAAAKRAPGSSVSPAAVVRAISSPYSRRRPPRVVYLAVVLLLLLFYFLPSSSRPPSPLSTEKPSQVPYSRDLVVAAVKHDDVSWIEKHLTGWTPRIYITDAANYGDTNSLTVPRNKGREANVYLTYIIDHYDHLPDYMVFIHSLRYQWHNEDPMYDGVPVIKNLQLPYLDKAGFLALRCSWQLGCPAELKPISPYAVRIDDRSHTEEAYARSFEQLFPNMTVPEVVGAACGGQFALTRKKILERPLSDYEHYRQWLMDTELPDSISGLMFGKPYVNCPPAKECFCNVFGLCNLECNSEDMCEKRYQLPRFATIPPGWPERGPGTEGWPARGWAD
ncbi:hypothetical protein Dda_2868 [Drechslerella dactyloides]|uniref:Uncharacterized protein n=1 Tax=Drechslerella dactyloides TaxID=74499 RepID=A0AAD6J098_DREDA|nr:hypothetical protein Dda_2868 [Drechslerella dactyloides]